ncbi:MAG: hypothetical protein NTW21_36025 [Verrucomicrobia bacterium]|nr:hypothetical protein [Verrucomicrobiota bacterium]
MEFLTAWRLMVILRPFPSTPEVADASIFDLAYSAVNVDALPGKIRRGVKRIVEIAAADDVI